jgi:hypothetical protein
MPMPTLGRCAGERRSCSAPAVVERQGRALCRECDELRRASRNARGVRKRRLAHDEGRCDPERCYYCSIARRHAAGVEATEETVRRGPGRPPLPPEERRGVVLRARVNQDQAAKVERLAARWGVDTAEVLRRLIDEA